MKLITAIVKQARLDEVMQAVTEAGAGGLTATGVQGFGQQHGHPGSGRSAGHKALLLPKVRVDVVVQDDDAETVVSAIAKAASTGAIGDGKIWVSAVDSVMRVRTGERGRQAV